AARAQAASAWPDWPETGAVVGGVVGVGAGAVLLVRRRRNPRFGRS
ncbi:LPXTG cell wall anchor domain-containing protein, partial [Streptomyces sp. SID5998]|nr:LPXTG cell wall anchor domain-containing protein [Streptomyces sp. SID5998]